MASKYHLENSLIDVEGTDIPHNELRNNSPNEFQCALLEAAYGLWHNQQVDGLVYQENIRAEWRYPL